MTSTALPSSLASLRLLVIDGTPGADQRRDRGVGTLYYDLFDTLVPGLAVTIAPLERVVLTGSDLFDQPWDGVVWGADSGLASVCSAPGPDLDAALAMIEACFARAIPQFGSGWGLHLAVLCAGGEVIQAPEQEAFPFVRSLFLTQSGVTHPNFQGRCQAFMAPALHADIIEVMPPHADILVLGPGNMIYGCEIRHRGGRFFGLQYQPESDLREIALFCQRHASALVEMRWFADTEQAAAFSRRCLECQMTERRDLRVALGIDREILDPARLHNELRHWLRDLAKD